jgi:hypothetical protein
MDVQLCKVISIWYFKERRDYVLVDLAFRKLQGRTNDPPLPKGKVIMVVRNELSVLLTTTDAVAKTCVPGQIKLIHRDTSAGKV